MAFNFNFEGVVAKMNEVAQTAAKKTKDTAAIAKHKVNIMTEEDKIKKAQVELGKLYYRDFTEGTDPNVDEYLPWCEKITASKTAIEEFKAAIEELKASGAVEEDDEIEVEIVTADEVPTEDVVTEADLADIQVEVVDDAPEAPEATEEN